MPENLQQRALDVVQMVLDAGAQGAFAWASRSRSLEFRYRDGALEKVQESTTRSISLQVYADGRYSSHSTTDLRPTSLSGFVAEAVALTRALQPDPHRLLPDPALYEGRPQVALDLVDDGVAALDNERRTAWCAEMDARVRENDRVISTTSYVYDDSSESAGASSNGFTGAESGTSVWIGTEVTLRDEDDKRPEDWEWAGGRHLDALPGPSRAADVALGRALARLGAAKGATRRTVMVVDPRASGRLLGSLLAPASAQAIQQGRSFWAGKQGQKLFGELLTLTDDPLIVRGLGSRTFDGEGIAARPLVLVEGGVVRNFYVDTYYGRKAGMAPTTGSSSNTVVGLGDRDLAAILADTPSGVYVTSWLGGNSDSNTGDFSFGMRGHVIDNGQVGAPVGEMNVTGNLAELFAHLVGVGNDPYPYSSMRAPTLVFEDVQFSGV